MKTDQKPTMKNKRQIFEIVISGLPSTKWPMHEEYWLDESGILFGAGDITDEYLLDAPTIRDGILNDFSRIEDEDSALDWVASYGMPVDCHSPFQRILSGGGGINLQPNELLMEELLLAAKDIRWIRRLSTLLKAKDVLGLSRLTHWWNDYPHLYESNICSWVTAPAGDSRLHRMTISETLLDTSHKFQGINKRPSRMAILFYPEDRNDWGGVFGLRDVRCTVHPRLIWLIGASNKYSFDELVLIACSIFLAGITDWLMDGINPSTNVELIDGAPVIRPVMQPSCPWDAVRLALYGELTSQSTLRVCPHPDCGATFTASRKDKMCCGKEKCQKYVTRLKKQGVEVCRGIA